MDAVYFWVKIRKRRACAGLRTYEGYTKIFQGKKFTKKLRSIHRIRTIDFEGSGFRKNVRFANLTQRF